MKFIVIALFSVIAILVYIRAVNSRKLYKCSECGESFRVELMNASRCKVCGAQTKVTENDDITDKA